MTAVYIQGIEKGGRARYELSLIDWDDGRGYLIISTC